MCLAIAPLVSGAARPVAGLATLGAAPTIGEVRAAGDGAGTQRAGHQLDPLDLLARRLSSARSAISTKTANVVPSALAAALASSQTGPMRMLCAGV
jgi:hypothetical protein